MKYLFFQVPGIKNCMVLSTECDNRCLLFQLLFLSVLCGARTLTSEFLTSSSPEGRTVNFPTAPDTGWPSFSQVMWGSGLPLAVQGRRAWVPSVADRSGRPVSIEGGTVGRGRST